MPKFISISFYHTALYRAGRFEFRASSPRPPLPLSPKCCLFRDLIRARGEDELRLTYARSLGGSVLSVNERYEWKGTGPLWAGLVGAVKDREGSIG